MASAKQDFQSDGPSLGGSRSAISRGRQQQIDQAGRPVLLRPQAVSRKGLSRQCRAGVKRGEGALCGGDVGGFHRERLRGGGSVGIGYAFTESPIHRRCWHFRYYSQIGPPAAMAESTRLIHFGSQRGPQHIFAALAMKDIPSETLGHGIR